MNSITWKPKALKQTRKLGSEKVRATIFDGVQVLNDFPNCAGVKALTNHEYQYRLRISHYRVFFNFDGAVSIASIEEVKKRDERTY